MSEYKYKQFIARMNYNTWVRIKAVFPSIKGESCQNYFKRLAKHLEAFEDYNQNGNK